MPVQRKKVIIAGASGLIGEAAARYFGDQPGWDVLGVSRRPPGLPAGAEWVALDLTDRSACDRRLGGRDDVTHVVYAAAHEVPGLQAGWRDSEVIHRNDVMLRNLMDPLLRSGRLRHVSLLQGTKAYGLHHPAAGWQGVRNPLRETDPRRDHPNFYFLQEDYLRQAQRSESWGLTIFRPTVVYGDALGNNMNLIPVIGAWAALLKEDGRRLDFPAPAMPTTVTEGVDVDLVARALGWAAESARAWGGTFNLTNGDVFTWPQAWSAIAECVGMEVGRCVEVSVAEELPRRSAQWAALVRRHHLQAPADIVDFAGYNSMAYADILFRMGAPAGGPVLNSTIAVRQAGFTDCIDTEEMFRKWLRHLQAGRLLPRGSDLG